EDRRAVREPGGRRLRGSPTAGSRHGLGDAAAGFRAPGSAAARARLCRRLRALAGAFCSARDDVDRSTPWRPDAVYPGGELLFLREPDDHTVSLATLVFSPLHLATISVADLAARPAEAERAPPRSSRRVRIPRGKRTRVCAHAVCADPRARRGD